MEMWARRYSYILTLLVVLSSFGMSMVILPDNARATTLYVGGIGPGNYTSIQDAINNASAGNTVFVHNGLYKEQILIEKTLSLIGEDVDATMIEVNSTGRGIYITANWVNVSGFTLTAKPWPPSSTPIIFGIELYQSQNCTIVNNKLQTNKKGIYLVDSSYNQVADNYAINNVDGIFLLNSHYNVIINNTAFSSNEAGFHLSSSNHNVIVGNNASGNGGDGIHLFSSYDNYLYHNYVFGNIGPSFDDGENCWDSCYPSGGNYWNAYSGTDVMSGSDQDVPGSDGIGDTAFDMPGGTNQDRYPLMSPASFPSSPSPPELVQVVAGDQQANLTWSPPLFDGFSSIIEYFVYRENSSGAEVLLASPGMAFEYSDTGLVNGETYTYRVSAANAVGEGCKSDDAIATPATLPGPPFGLIAYAGIEEITLIWSPPSNDGGSAITSYVLYRGTTSGSLTFLAITGSSYIDSGLTTGQEYFYKISAVNGIGEGPRSNEASAIPLDPPPNEPPTCAIDVPISGSVVFANSQIAGRAHDADGIVEKVEFRIDDGPWTLVVGTLFWSYDWNTTAVQDGPHTIFARSFDGENYSNLVNATVTVDNLVGDDNLPTTFFFIALFIIVVLVIVAMVVGYILMRWLDRVRARELEQSQSDEPPEQEQEPEEPE
jgi:parallel beta-helix repeat protein